MVTYDQAVVYDNASITFEGEGGESTLLTDLVSYWPLDETSGTRNDSHGTNHLTDNATVLFATGKQGNAADFETSNSEYLSIAHNSTLALGSFQAFTIAVWIKAESLTGITHRTIFCKAVSPNFEYNLTYVVATQELQLQLSTDGTSGFAVGIGLPNTDFNWHFVVAWRDPVAAKTYIQLDNGTPAETAFAVDNYQGTGALNVGRNPNATTWRWDGLMDELGFWKRVLTSDERTYLYNSGNARTYAELGNAFADGAFPTTTVTPIEATVAIGTTSEGSIGVITTTVPTATVSTGVSSSAAIGTVTVSAPSADATGAASASGVLGTLTVSPPEATATGTASASGDFGILTVFPFDAAVSGGVTTSGSIGTVVTSVLEADVSTSVTASGTFGSIVVVAPTASASGAGTVDVIGVFATVSVEAIEATVSTDTTASGSLGTTTVSPPEATVAISGSATGDFPVVSIEVISATVSAIDTATGSFPFVNVLSPEASVGASVTVSVIFPVVVLTSPQVAFITYASTLGRTVIIRSIRQRETITTERQQEIIVSHRRRTMVIRREN